MKEIYRYFKKKLQFLLPQFYKEADKRKIVIKYLVAGSVATGADILLLYILTDIAKMWYLLSTGIAFVAAFFISFYLQKFWTFRDNNCEKVAQQAVSYFFVGLTNLGINTIGVYFLVEKLATMYLWAQIMMVAPVAVSSFLIYKYVIFRKKK